MNEIAALYSRLSEEDREKQNETDDSRSIQNQKSMLISYALEQGWEIYHIYSDDDFKGSDRNRPAFNQLMKDAEEKKFNIVLCKSQARFTRELELVEKIIHGQFIEWGIRFVGLADYADTANKGNKKSRQINGLVNEWYLEDLSDNIKTVLTDHRKKGMHIGSFALYGYQKDPEKKGHLIIDPEAAAVVRKVFELYASGTGRTAIARILNDNGIPNPTEYKRQRGMRFKGTGHSCSTLWKYYAISDMLSNEMYLGNMVQGKYENLTYKSKNSKPVPRERWITVEGTHDPIIDKDLWDTVQQRIRERSRPMCNGRIGLFAGKTRCMYCGYTLASSKSREFYYLKCTSGYYCKSSCKGAFIAQRFLEQVILNELNHILQNYFNESAAKEKITFNKNYETRKKDLQRNLYFYQMKIMDLQKALQNTYVDKVKGIISEQEYLDFREAFQNEIKSCQAVAEEIRQQISALNQLIYKKSTKADILNQYKKISKLDRVIVDTLIAYIEIGRKDQKKHKTDLPPITIHWKF